MSVFQIPLKKPVFQRVAALKFLKIRGWALGNLISWVTPINTIFKFLFPGSQILECGVSCVTFPGSNYTRIYGGEDYVPGMQVKCFTMIF